jgi:hypothetical protein
MPRESERATGVGIPRGTQKTSTPASQVRDLYTRFDRVESADILAVAAELLVAEGREAVTRMGRDGGAASGGMTSTGREVVVLSK